jgi:hypothetical protein
VSKPKVDIGAESIVELYATTSVGDERIDDAPRKWARAG